MLGGNELLRTFTLAHPMNKPTVPTLSARERLRQQWLQQAEAAFELLFAEDQQEHLVTFAQREARVSSLTNELATWLLEQHTAEDAAVRLSEEQTAACPKCGRPGVRQTPRDAPLPARHLTCDAGEVTVRREQWRCKTCRVSFFPSGREA
jgi:hypothetical protein